MAIRSIQLDAGWKKFLLVGAAAALAIGVWFVVRWSMGSSAVHRVDNAELALYLTQLAPDDPQTHYVAAVFLERSFDPEDIAKAIRELEIATSRAPENYALWLELGRARERSGDPEGAEAALRHALSLAPNYSRVQWALGNSLLRQGRIEEAFTEIRKSVRADGTFAGPAASAAWQFFDGDVARIRAAVGDSIQFNAALAGLLVREKRFDEAFAVWNELPAAEKSTTLKETGTHLLARFVEAKKYRHAVQVAADIETTATLPKPATFTNGGFESAVKPDGAGPFEWQIAPGLQPQIVISTAQKHGGDKSLLLIFNTGDGKDFRPVSQNLAVPPGKNYELETFYRSELKTAAVFRWEVVDVADGKQISATAATAPQAEWTRLTARFRTGASADGVTVRLIREGCGPVCSVAGNLWFDDFVLREVE